MLKSQTNAEGQDNLNSSDELKIERNRVEGTPFWIVGNAYRGWMLVLGNHQVTPIYPNVPELMKHMETNKWDMIVTLTMVAAEFKIKEIIQTGKLIIKNKKTKQNGTNS